MNKPSDPDGRVTEVLLRWEELRKAGQNPNVEELCRDDPELVSKVAREINALEDMELLLATKQSEKRGDAPGAPVLAISSGSKVSARSGYRVTRFHARGGRSEVHAARDEKLARNVAIKFISRQYSGDAGSRERFHREAKITSGLDHPGVVPVYGAGRDEQGNPFYCMRMVEGQTLREAIHEFHADQSLQQDAGQRQLAFRQLLGHFVDACQTIAYAHNRSVVHRDIKPENIVLGAYGETIVLDWGLAKSTLPGSLGPDEDTIRLPAEVVAPITAGADNELTQLGSVLGTPAYMSPEQASGRGEIGVASDICNLGATLYTLIVGRPPYDGSNTPDVIRKAARRALDAPRKVDRRIPRALESICLKAMSRDPSERYASAADLAADVERYLADEPVVAYSEPWHVRVGRWSRKYKTLMRAAAISLIIISGVSVTAAFVISAQKRMADTALNESDRLVDILEELIGVANPQVDVSEINEILDKVVTELESSTDFTQRGRIRLLHVIARTYAGLGMKEKAVQLFEVTLDMAYERPDKPNWPVSEQTGLAAVLLQLGRVDEAITHLEENAQIAERLGMFDWKTPFCRRLVIRNHRLLSEAYLQKNKRNEAIQLAELAVERARQYLRESTHELGYADKALPIDCMTNLGRAYFEVGRQAEAIKIQREVIAKRRETLGDRHSQTMDAIARLADYTVRVGRVDEGLRLYLEVLAWRRQELGNRHDKTLGTISNVADAYRQVGRLDESVRYYEEALPAVRINLDDSEPLKASMLIGLGKTYRGLSRHDEAIALHREGVQLRQQAFGKDHPATIDAANALAETYLETKRYDAAIDVANNALAYAMGQRGQEHYTIVALKKTLCDAYEASQRFDEALPLIEVIVAFLQAELGPDHPNTKEAKRDLERITAAMAGQD